MLNLKQYLEEKLILINNGAKYGQVVFFGGGGACFAPGTLVKTKIGYTPIENIKIGDMVYSYNTKTQQAELKEVIKLFKYDAEELLKLEFDTQTIICTLDHEFLTMDGTYVKARDITETTKLCELSIL